MGKDEDKKQNKPAEEIAGWQYAASKDSAKSAVQGAEENASDSGPATVEWTASEFVAHEKDFGWYAIFVAGTLVITALVFLITRDTFAAAAILIMATILGIVGSHKPRTIEYRLDGRGLTAGGKFYPFSAYKSFSMPEQEPFTVLTLTPMKRLGFPVSVYLAPDNQQKAIDLVADHLPLERGELDGFERLMRNLRF